MREKKFLTYQKQLEDRIGAKMNYLFEQCKFNPPEPIDCLGDEFEPTLKDLDIQQCCNRYKWNGLPEYLSGFMIELMLYTRGSLCGYFEGGVLYIMPYAQSGGLNVYGLPNRVKPITYNGEATTDTKTLGLELAVSSLGSLNKNAQACLLFDRLPYYSAGNGPISRSLLNAELIKYQCDLLARIRNNLRNIDKKVVFWAESEAQAKQLDKDLKAAYSSPKPYIIAIRNSSLDRGEKSQTLQNGVDVETQSLFETWQSINSIRCMCSGITNGGAFEKKERKITGELQGDQTQTELVLDAGLKMRKLFIEQMKIIYPQKAEILGKISVEINRDLDNVSYETLQYQEQENGNNESEVEE